MRKEHCEVQDVQNSSSHTPTCPFLQKTPPSPPLTRIAAHLPLCPLTHPPQHSVLPICLTLLQLSCHDQKTALLPLNPQVPTTAPFHSSAISCLKGSDGTSRSALADVRATSSALGRSFPEIRPRDTSGATPCPVCRANTLLIASSTSHSTYQVSSNSGSSWLQGGSSEGSGRGEGVSPVAAAQVGMGCT